MKSEFVSVSLINAPGGASSASPSNFIRPITVPISNSTTGSSETAAVGKVAWPMAAPAGTSVAITIGIVNPLERMCMARA